MLAKLMCSQLVTFRSGPQGLRPKLQSKLLCASHGDWRSRDLARTLPAFQPRVQAQKLSVRVHAEPPSHGVASSRTHAVINFYHLSDIAKPGETAAMHKDYIQEQGWDIRGRIYISFQGVNAQFSGPREDAIAYTSWVASQPEFKGVVWREYPVEKHMFPKLRLKFRPNLISLRGGMEDLPVTDATNRAKPLAPAEWRQMLRDAAPVRQSESPPNLTGTDVPQAPIILDVRNGYEWDAGHFQGAERPQEDEFNETPRRDEGEDAVPEYLRGADPDTPVMMYCTGGIRCDIYSTFLRQQGFRNLYSLEGGIQNYLEEEGADRWNGALYVFDDRMAVSPAALRHGGDPAAAGEAGAAEEVGLGEEGAAHAAAPCAVCGGAPRLPHINCANVDCNLLFLACRACTEELQGCCCEACRDEAPRLLRPIKDGAYRSMTNYAPKQRGALQRLLTPERAAKLAAARARRRERLKSKQNEKQILKAQRKQQARQAMAALAQASAGTEGSAITEGSSASTEPSAAADPQMSRTTVLH
eukprot:jgi/Ulvmu1/7119/UM034_0025.1